MNLVEIQTDAYHYGTNQSIWIDVDKICSVEQRTGKALITFIGGSQVYVTVLGTFPQFMDSLRREKK